MALITGGARRIGAAIVRRLHAAGFQIMIHCYRSRQAADQLAVDLNALRPESACVVSANLMEHAEVLALVANCVQWRGHLNVVVNNASAFMRTATPGFDEKACHILWTTNVLAPSWLSEAAYLKLAEQGGCIINLTDIHAERPLKDYAFYCQTKAALKMQTEALARAYAPLVRVNAVAPGSTLWPEGMNHLSASQQQDIIAKTPLACHGDPTWVADAVLFLIENQWITGETIRVDGGRHLV